MAAMGTNGQQRKGWPTKLADTRSVENDAAWDSLTEGARLVEPGPAATHTAVARNGNGAIPTVTENGAASRLGSAQLSPTLKHLAGPNPAKEWSELCLEEERLLDRLQKVVVARGRLELHMAMAGVALRRSVQTEAPAEEE